MLFSNLFIFWRGCLYASKYQNVYTRPLNWCKFRISGKMSYSIVPVGRTYELIVHSTILPAVAPAMSYLNYNPLTVWRIYITGRYAYLGSERINEFEINCSFVKRISHFIQADRSFEWKSFVHLCVWQFLFYIHCV